MKYEDLVDQPKETLEKLASFLGMSWYLPNFINAANLQHVHSESESTKDYYGTVRTHDHKHDSWRTKMNPERIKYVESFELCSKMIQKLGYELFSSNWINDLS